MTSELPHAGVDNFIYSFALPLLYRGQPSIAFSLAIYHNPLKTKAHRGSTLINIRYFCSSSGQSNPIYPNADTLKLDILKENKGKAGVYL
jgi:hypothetical protein